MPLRDAKQLYNTTVYKTTYWLCYNSSLAVSNFILKETLASNFFEIKIKLKLKSKYRQYNQSQQHELLLCHATNKLEVLLDAGVPHWYINGIT